MQEFQIYILLFLENLFVSFFVLSFVVSRLSELYRIVTTITSVRKLGICCTAKDIPNKELLLRNPGYYSSHRMSQDNNIQSPSRISSDVEQVPYESVCTCKMCNHGSARDCSKSGCKCCKKENHSMIMDGIEGFYSTDK